MGVDCEQLALLQPESADVDECGSAASAERATVHGGAEQNRLSTATDIYCAPWKKCRTEQNLNHAWVCGNVCQHKFQFACDMGLHYSWYLQLIAQDFHVYKNFLLSLFYQTLSFTHLLKMGQDSGCETKLETEVEQRFVWSNTIVFK